MFSTTEVFDIAIQLEENGERLYRMAAEGIEDGSLRQLLCWLAEEEVRHRARFVEMKRRAGVLKPREQWADEVSGAILQSVIGDHAFCLDDLDPGSLQNETDLMRIAIEFEQDGILFYEMIRSFITESAALAQLDAILDEERRHVELFRNRLASQKVDSPSGLTTGKSRS